MTATIWARSDGAAAYCALLSVSDSATTTYCRQSWAAVVDVDPAPSHLDRCESCVRALIERRRVERGLDELVAVTADVGGAL